MMQGTVKMVRKYEDLCSRGRDTNIKGNHLSLIPKKSAVQNPGSHPSWLTYTYSAKGGCPFRSSTETLGFGESLQLRPFTSSWSGSAEVRTLGIPERVGELTVSDIDKVCPGASSSLLKSSKTPDQISNTNRILYKDSA